MTITPVDADAAPTTSDNNNDDNNEEADGYDDTIRIDTYKYIYLCMYCCLYVFTISTLPW